MKHDVEHLNIRVEVLDDDDNPHAGRVREFSSVHGKSAAYIYFDHGFKGGWFLTSELKRERS